MFGSYVHTQDLWQLSIGLQVVFSVSSVTTEDVPFAFVHPETFVL
jgi:hypothetical protein